MIKVADATVMKNVLKYRGLKKSDAIIVKFLENQFTLLQR
jgi:hypothetical protein